MIIWFLTIIVIIRIDCAIIIIIPKLQLNKYRIMIIIYFIIIKFHFVFEMCSIYFLFLF